MMSNLANREAPAAPSRRLLSLALWVCLPATLTVWGALHIDAHPAGDFYYAFWPAGHRILHGLSPYVAPGSPVITRGVAFVYPAPAALLVAPFALLPHGLANDLFAALNLAAVLLALRLLEVRDRRLYGLALLCPAVWSGWVLANISLLLALGVAAIWRYRERPLIAGLLTALLMSLKLFLWPLALWLLATRRYLALAYAAAWGLAFNLIAWTVLGWSELEPYTRLLQALARTEAKFGYSLTSLLVREGTSRSGAYALALGLAAACALACLWLGRRGRPVGALALALAVSLLASPIVQLHYFALLLVPLALVRPRLDLAWTLPLAMWACVSVAGHAVDTIASTWEMALALSLGAAIVAVAVRGDARSAGEPITTRQVTDRVNPVRIGLLGSGRD